MVATVSARTDALQFSNLALLLLKLAAFAVMVFDHTDFFGLTSWGVHDSIGRMVFPVFGVVLAYNLARVDPLKLIRTVAPRLVLLGLVASLFYLPLQGHWWPLNIMFSLALATVVYATARLGEPLAAFLLAMLAGYFVDYAWFGVFGIWLVADQFRRGGQLGQLFAVLAFAVLLTPINGNLHALWAVPVLWVASFVSGDAPRCRWLFWAGYPVHLAVLVLLSWAI